MYRQGDLQKNGSQPIISYLLHNVDIDQERPQHNLRQYLQPLL